MTYSAMSSILLLRVTKHADLKRFEDSFRVSYVQNLEAISVAQNLVKTTCELSVIIQQSSAAQFYAAVT